MSELLFRTAERPLWYEGPNFTADAVVLDPEAAKVLLIQRSDTGEWALPGGFIDRTDDSSCQAAIREISEEAGLTLSGEAPLIFRGKVEDPRNTEESWIETSAHLFTIPSSTKTQSGDDAIAAHWHELAELPPLYGSHLQLIEHGLEYLDSALLLDIANAPDATRLPVEGGYMQYDKWIIESSGQQVFTKDCPKDNPRADELLQYIKKEAGIMAHLRRNGFTHLPQYSLFNDDSLIMDAILREDGWQWQLDQTFIDTQIGQTLDAFSELESMPLPPSSYDVEDSYTSFIEEGWNVFNETTHRTLIDKYTAFTATLSPQSEAAARELLAVAPELCTLAEMLPRSETFVFCHHDIRESNFAWHPSEGLKIIDWSWAGPGIPGSDATRLLIDLHKNGLSVDAYREYINPEHCLNLIGFWLTRSTLPNQGADGLREQQFISALNAYELLRAVWPMTGALVSEGPGYVDRA